MNPKLLLASQSPRRRELLGKLKTNFEVRVPEFLETSRPNLSPEQEVLELACGKAKSLAEPDSENLILACDTLVVLGSKKMGKPKDFNDAVRMLGELSGKTHRVLTGVYLLESSGNRAWEGIEETQVKFHNFSENQAREYVKTGEPLDKAGAYGIQDKGAKLVESIEGDYFNVVGLPLKRVAKMLGVAGIKINIDLQKIYRESSCFGSQKAKFSK